MISTFDLVRLNAILKDFYTLTRIRITVFNDKFKELAAYPKDIATFCRLIRTDPQAEAQCIRCDRKACSIAAKRHSTYLYQCHAGLTEAISPIYIGNIVIGYLFFGHVFSYESHEDGWESIKACCKDYNLDMALLKAACSTCPIISNDFITAASQILHAVASYLCLERMAVLKNQELPAQIDDYINAHLAEGIDVNEICNHFQIGKTHLYEIANQSYGIGIAGHIRNLRIEKAKTLLADCPDMKITEIAFACGFGDGNYFATLFKRLNGLTPRQYRQIQ